MSDIAKARREYLRKGCLFSVEDSALVEAVIAAGFTVKHSSRGVCYVMEWERR